MGWRPKRGDQHYVESHVEPGEIRACRQESLGGAANASPLPRSKRRGSRVDFAARLHLDHGEHLTASRYDVDLAGGATPIAGDDAPAMQPQMPMAKPFRKTPAALRSLAAERWGV
jgi:hypothetical protein